MTAANPANATQMRRALVTGGANGIGRAICQRPAADGYAVAIADIDHVEAARLAKQMVPGRVDLKPVAAGIPLGRLARPADIAAALAFSSSAGGRGMNGQTVHAGDAL